MPDSSRIRFGTFDFDPTTRELRREGLPVRLQSQPAQVLALLLSQAGEVVPREALRQAVWGTETFVDFDRGLNFCVAQIRTALGDSADSPRYIKTLPKRGYQFIAPVTPAAPEAPPTPTRPIVVRRLNPWWVAVPAVLAVCAALLILRSRPEATLTIAVARFDNQTGSPEFDTFADNLTDSVVADLTNAGAGRYAVIGNASILRLPRSQRDLLAIGSTLKANYVVIGQVQEADAQVHVLAHLIRLPDQKHISVTRFDRTPDTPLPNQTAMSRRIAADFNKRLSVLPRPANN